MMMVRIVPLYRSPFALSPRSHDFRNMIGSTYYRFRVIITMMSGLILDVSLKNDHLTVELPGGRPPAVLCPSAQRLVSEPVRAQLDRPWHAC
jgi:hypothetical protein